MDVASSNLAEKKRVNTFIPEEEKEDNSCRFRAASAAEFMTVLTEAISETESLGKDFSSELGKLNSLKERFSEGRFHLAVLGQFKRGKSTLLNALLGEELLPTSVVPLTAIPTFLRSGTVLRATISFINGKKPKEFYFDKPEELNDILVKYVTEDGNSKNKKEVSHVEVYHPSPILRDGVILIDTPGVGSTIKHNTEMTMNFLPQCDAAMFLISADPPITEVEVEFLKKVKSKVSHLFFILNKVDYLSKKEQTLSEKYFLKVLKEQVGIDKKVDVFSVSARKGLDAALKDNSKLWTKSGMGKVESHLMDFLVNEKATTLQKALASKAFITVSDILFQLNITIRSLGMPIEELEASLKTFEGELSIVSKRRTIEDDLLKGDGDRIVKFLEERVDNLRDKAQSHFENVMEKSMTNMTEEGLVNEENALNDIATEIPLFFEKEHCALSKILERNVTLVLEGHQKSAAALIDSIQKSAADLFKIPRHSSKEATAIDMSEQPYWVTDALKFNSSPSYEMLIDKILAFSSKHKKLKNRLLETRIARVEKRLHERCKSLILYNAEKLRWSLLEEVNETLRIFRVSMDERLGETITAIQGGIKTAMKKRKARKKEVSGEVADLQKRIDEFTRIQGEF